MNESALNQTNLSAEQQALQLQLDELKKLQAHLMTENQDIEANIELNAQLTQDENHPGNQLLKEQVRLDEENKQMTDAILAQEGKKIVSDADRQVIE